MDKQKLIFIGAGGHSKSVLDSVDLDLYEIVGFIDSNKTGMHFGKHILGKDFQDIPDYKKYKYFVSIGDNLVRKSWYERIKELGLETINIIDKTAVISLSVSMGQGNFIGKYAIINTDSAIGDNNIINTKALIEHECVIGSHIHLSTNSTINGNVTVKDYVFFGSGAVCNGQLKIGERAIIGSGSVIIEDVQEFTTVVGVPARIIKRRLIV